MSNASDEEPEIVVIAQKEVVISTGRVGGINGATRTKQNNKQNKQSITKAMNDTSNDKTNHDMTLSRDAVVELDG